MQSKSDRGGRAFAVASMIVCEQVSLDQPLPSFRVFQKHFHGTKSKGLQSGNSAPVLRYDSRWMGEPSSLIRDFWCTLHGSLATTSTDHNKFDVMIWLATMAYASKADMDILRALVAFYRVPELASIHIPTKPQYQMSQGSDFEVTEVQSAARLNAKSFRSSTEVKLPKDRSETNK